VIELTSKIENAADFVEALRSTLPKAVGDNVTAGALKRAARPMLRAQRAAYRRLGKSGSLAAAASVWRVKGRTRYGATIRIGPIRQSWKGAALYSAYYGRGVIDIRHSHLVEKGTSFRTTRKGASRGQVEGKWIIRDAGRATVAECARIYKATVYGDMQKAIQRRARRGIK